MALLLSFAGCIRPDLVACGDLSCPRGSMCVNDSLCAAPDQVAACDGVADGTICHASSGDGNCSQGVCAPSVCGDGMVTGLEQCDGDTIPVGCTDLGYYTGTVACTKYCSVDRSGCSGRCGDGIVQANEGELCDSSPPAGSCMDYGEDVGELACSAGCGIGLADCGRLDWFPTKSIETTTIAIAGAHGWLAYVDTAGHAYAVYDHHAIEHDGTFAAVAVADSSIWAIGPTTVAQWTPATGWIDSAAPWPATSTVGSAWASDALGLWVSLGGVVPVWQLANGTWSMVTGPWGQSVTFENTRSVVMISADQGLAQFDGTSWTAYDGPTGTDSVAEDDLGRLWAISGTVQGTPMPTPPAGTTLSLRTNGVWADAGIGFYGYIAVAPSEGGMFISGFGIQLEGVGQIPTVVSALVSVGQAPFSISWSGGPQDFPGLASDGVSPFAIEAAAPIQTLDGQWVGLGSPYEIAFGHAHGGRLVVSYASGNAVDALDEHGNLDPITLPDGVAGCSLVAVSLSGRLYCYDGASLWEGAVSQALASANAMWVAGDDSAVAVGGNDLFASRTSAGWNVSAPAMSFSAIGGSAYDDLYAIATADGGTPALWHFDGTAWTAVTSGDAGLSQLVVGATRVYALDASGLMAFDRATGTVSHPTLPFAFSQITGDSGDELFAIANTASPSSLWHYDGTYASPMRAADTVNGIYAFGDQLVMFTNTPIHDGPPNLVALYRLARTASW